MGEAARKRRMIGKTIPINVTDPRTGKTLGEARYAGSIHALREEYRAASKKEPFELSVPCGSCTACCWHPCVDVYPEHEKPEDLAHLSIVENPNGGLMLQKRDDGACVHLGTAGCTVYDHRPRACRAYDCRLIAATGMADRYDGDKLQPSWIFHADSQHSRILQLALRMGAARLAFSGGAAVKAAEAAFANLPKNLPIATKIVQEFDALPRNQQDRMMSEIFNQCSPLSDNPSHEKNS